MLPILYLILIRRNGSPYPEVTVVSLPSSLMIVHSNAFVFSTSLPEVVFRYGFYLNKKKMEKSKTQKKQKIPLLSPPYAVATGGGGILDFFCCGFLNPTHPKKYLAAARLSMVIYLAVTLFPEPPSTFLI